MSGWLANALRFEGSRLGDMWAGIKKDPKRLVLGVDPLSTGAWNAVLGREDQPIVGDFGGPTQANYDNAEAKGIPTGSAQTLNGIAKTVASVWGGAAAGGALGGGGASSLNQVGSGAYANGALADAGFGGAAGSGGAAAGGAGLGRYAMPAVKAIGGMAQPGAPMPVAQAPAGMNGSAQARQPQQVGAPMNAGPGPVIDDKARKRAMMAQILRGGL